MGAGKTRPLTGIRIVEFAGIGPGPYAAMLLADMGAEIIRLDRPGGADPFVSVVFPRGRASLTVDMKKPADVAGILALLDGADALIEGYRPGVMERLGLGPEVVLKRSPRLVYGRMTGWGQDGPYAHSAGHDINYIAITGALNAIGGSDKPVPPLNLVGDFGGGSLFLVAGLLAGIIHARATGEGQVVDAAICDGTASLMAMMTAMVAQQQWSMARADNLLDGGAPFYRVFRCADGKFLSVGALEEKFYADLVRLSGFDHTGLERMNRAHWPALHQRWEALFATRTRDEWAAVFAGSDACVAAVADLTEAAEEPHLKARGGYVRHEGVTQPAPAPRFSKGPNSIPVVADPPKTLAEAVARWTSQAG